MKTYHSPIVKQYLQNNLKKHALLPAEKNVTIVSQKIKENKFFLIIMKN